MADIAGCIAENIAFAALGTAAGVLLAEDTNLTGQEGGALYSSMSMVGSLLFGAVAKCILTAAMDEMLDHLKHQVDENLVRAQMAMVDWHSIRDDDSDFLDFGKEEDFELPDCDCSVDVTRARVPGMRATGRDMIKQLRQVNRYNIGHRRMIIHTALEHSVDYVAAIAPGTLTAKIREQLDVLKLNIERRASFAHNGLARPTIASAMGTITGFYGDIAAGYQNAAEGFNKQMHYFAGQLAAVDRSTKSTQGYNPVPLNDSQAFDPTLRTKDVPTGINPNLDLGNVPANASVDLNSALTLDSATLAPPQRSAPQSNTVNSIESNGILGF